MSVIKRVAAWASAVTGVVAVMGIAYAAADYTGVRPVTKKEFDVVAGNTNYLLFLRLDAKAHEGTITLDERIIYCRVARELGLAGKGCA